MTLHVFTLHIFTSGRYKALESLEKFGSHGNWSVVVVTFLVLIRLEFIKVACYNTVKLLHVMLSCSK